MKNGILFGLLFCVSVSAADLDRAALVKFSESTQKFYERTRSGMVQDVQVERAAFAFDAMVQALLKEWDAAAASNRRVQIEAIILYLRPYLEELSDAVSHAQNGWDLEGDLRMLRTFVDLIESVDVPAVIPATPLPTPSPTPFSFGAKFVTIPAGTFMMGSSTTERGRMPGEDLPHSVTISQDFEMQTTEVTQAQWKAVMGINPSYFDGADRPVEQVSWNDVQAFITKLNSFSPIYKYRLPTEEEWEYAARAGAKTAYFFGDDRGQLENFAWFSDNSRGQTQSVAQKPANAYGLYDMHGNVMEWLSDEFEDFNKTPCRGVRSCSWHSDASSCRLAVGHVFSTRYRSDGLGFRLVRKTR